MKHFCLAAIMTAGTLVAPAATVNVQDLLQRSVAAMQRNWKESPNYVFTDREVEEKLGSSGAVASRTVKTYDVSMMDGSPYQRLVAVNDKPLPPAQQKAQQQKMEAERRSRASQSNGVRKRRIAKYEKERKQDQAMLREMVHAFNYRLIGEETVNGRETYVLDATPKPGYVPTMRDTKVLTGMKGKLWIDKSETQWVKVEAEVMRPVSFYAVATVGPGTKFILENEPVGGGIWQPKHFAVHVNSTIFWISRNSAEDERYGDYRRVGSESASAK